jgi:hypothetical protein
VKQSSKSEEEIRGSAQSSPEAIIRDGTIVRSVYIFGTVEGRGDGLAEERFDDLLDSTLSSSPELLVKINRDNCRAVEDGAQLSKESLNTGPILTCSG